MSRGPLYEQENYKPSFSGHQTFPLRYGWLKKVYDEVIDKKVENSKSIFSANDAIVTFGVGKNMVDSIKFWAERSGVLETSSNGFKVSAFGDIVFNEKKGDPWVESAASNWLIHWNIASNPKSTTCFYIFNYYSQPNFDRDTLQEQITKLVQDRQWQMPSPATLKKDIDCFLQLYSPNLNVKIIEDQMSSALSELGLIHAGNNKTYYLSRGRKKDLPLEVFAYALVKFWRNYDVTGKTISVEALTYEPGSPGRVFLLREEDIMEYMYKIHDAIPEISFNESGGLKQLTLTGNILTLNIYGPLEAMYKNH